MAEVATGKDVMEWLRTMGIVSDLTRRVVIDAVAGEPVKIYVELYGSEEMLAVEPPAALRGAVIQTLPGTLPSSAPPDA